MIALKRAWVDVEIYYASEIDKYATQVSEKNYPNIIRLWDVNNWREWDLWEIDLIIWGSPCQWFSFAGKQLAFDDPRSKLFFTMVDIINYYKPKYFLLENVKMKKEYQDVITEYMWVEPIMINSALVSAQNRKRLYWTNIPWIEQPKDKWILISDIMDTNVDESFQYRRTYYRRGVSGKMPTLTANMWTWGNNVPYVVAASVRWRYLDELWNRKDIKWSKTKQYLEIGWHKSHTLTSVDKDSLIYMLEEHWYLLRKLTPVECERLQTLPDNYTEGVSNTQRYKSLWNWRTVDIIAHIFSFISNT